MVLRTLGGAGYLAAFFGWLAVVMFALPRLFDIQMGEWLIPKPVPASPQTVVPPSQVLEPSAALVVLTMLFVLGFLALVVYVVVMKYIPAVTKATSKVVHTTARKSVPVIARKPAEKISPKRRKRLTERFVLWLKITYALLPAIFFAIVYAQRHTLMREAAVMVTSTLAALSVVLFIVQLYFARRWRAREPDVL